MEIGKFKRNEKGNKNANSNNLNLLNINKILKNSGGSISKSKKDSNSKDSL